MNLADLHNKKPFIQRFEEMPRRIFLDSNIVQYLNDFPEVVFEGQETNPLITSKGKEIPYGGHLYNQITSLHFIFTPVTRLPYQFAVSEYVFQEVQRKNDRILNDWFKELWNYWNRYLAAERKHAFVGWGKRKLSRLQGDRSLQSGLSKKDLKIVSDAFLLECDCILTCDRFRKRQVWMYDKYHIMILYPTDFSELIRPFQALWF